MPFDGMKYNNGNSAPVSTMYPQLNDFYWQRKSLIELQKETFFGQLADTTTMPKHFGKTIKLYHYLPLLDDRNINDQGINAAGSSTGTVYYITAVVAAGKKNAGRLVKKFTSTVSAADAQDKAKGLYGALADSSEDGITALNTMLAQDALLIYVPKNVKVDRAIQVINILRSDVELMVNRRVLVVLEQGADAKLLFCDHAADDRNFLATQVVEVFVGENAHLDMTCLEETHYKNVRVSNVYIDQKANSRVDHNVITLHNGVTRNRTDLVFSGEGAECYMNGCVIADKEQRVDNNTLIDHKVPHCDSHELYKYVLDDKAVGAFAGRVLVRKDAQKTTSQETNQNLCATKECRMYTQPMLEIYADDVKCAHGSTVGQLNDKALFYMQQRGVSLEEARTLLQNAFIGEVIDRIQVEPLRDRLRHLVEKRFRGELNKCEGCKLCR